MEWLKLQYHRPTNSSQLQVHRGLFSAYGGSQTYHLNCFYESVVKYMQSNGWLDTVLNKEWDVDAFQFYAGDLFDTISTLYLSFEPKEILDGACIAQKDGLSFVSNR